MKFYKEKKRHVVASQTEHKCVLDFCRHLQEEGFEVTYLPVGNDGIVVDLEKLGGGGGGGAIRPDTPLVVGMGVGERGDGV